MHLSILQKRTLGLLCDFTSMERSVQDISLQYQDFNDIFEKKNSNMLLKHRPYDCSIELQDGAQPPFG